MTLYTYVTCCHCTVQQHLYLTVPYFQGKGNLALLDSLMVVLLRTICPAGQGILLKTWEKKPALTVIQVRRINTDSLSSEQRALLAAVRQRSLLSSDCCSDSDVPISCHSVLHKYYALQHPDWSVSAASEDEEQDADQACDLLAANLGIDHFNVMLRRAAKQEQDDALGQIKKPK